jgi:hypothetical protein
LSFIHDDIVLKVILDVLLLELLPDATIPELNNPLEIVFSWITLMD